MASSTIRITTTTESALAPALGKYLMMDPTTLASQAEKIPSMGGAQIGTTLRALVRNATPNTAIIEVGCWLGAGTAQIALGALERTDADVQIHCYDRWVANQAEVEKAAAKGLMLEINEDLLPYVRRFLKPFPYPIEFHQGDIRYASWEGPPISVYIDDASKTRRLFLHSLKTFSRHWIPGETVIVLMDYNMWRKSGNPEHACQKEFIEAHPLSFEQIENSLVSIFRYIRPVNVDDWIYQQQSLLITDLSKQLSKRTKEISQMKSSLSWRAT